MYETILSPVNYGGLQLKNRIIFAPTTFGLPDEEYLAEIRRLAEGGCAMLIIGDVPVGKSKFEKSLFDAKGFAFYQQIVEIAHKADCKVCAQLHQSDSNMLAMLKYIPAVLVKKLTPDQLREKLNAEVEPYITKMPKRKIEAILAGFGKAAVLAKQAGFDMVQVHGDRMCGSFSSSIFTHRTMNTAAAPRTAPVLPWKRSRPSTPPCRNFPLTTSWPSGRKIPTTATQAFWWKNCPSLCRCWNRRA